MEGVSLKMASGTFGEERGTKKAKYDQFEETELRLGLPGPGGSADQGAVAKSDVDLKLNLSSSSSASCCLVEMDMDVTPPPPAAAAKEMVLMTKTASKPPPPPPASAKAPVVGWPPVRSFRKNTLSVAHKIKEESADQNASITAAAAAYVKVSMDGAPYLRKVDLNMYRTYRDLCDALAKMFCFFTIGNYGADGMKDFMNDNKLVDLSNGSEYVPTYEDKDGDWMLVGDVPWEMFIESCKRMRIMKGKEAVGLAPRAMEKCKNRN